MMKNKIMKFAFCTIIFFLCFGFVHTILSIGTELVGYFINSNPIDFPESKYYIGYAIMSPLISIYYLWEVDKRNR